MFIQFLFAALLLTGIFRLILLALSMSVGFVVLLIAELLKRSNVARSSSFESFSQLSLILFSALGYATLLAVVTRHFADKSESPLSLLIFCIGLLVVYSDLAVTASQKAKALDELTEADDWRISARAATLKGATLGLVLGLPFFVLAYIYSNSVASILGITTVVDLVYSISQWLSQFMLAKLSIIFFAVLYFIFTGLIAFVQARTIISLTLKTTHKMIQRGNAT